MGGHQRVKKAVNADDLPIIRDTGTRASTDSTTRSALLSRFEDLDNLLGTIWEALDVAGTVVNIGCLFTSRDVRHLWAEKTRGRKRVWEARLGRF